MSARTAILAHTTSHAVTKASTTRALALIMHRAWLAGLFAIVAGLMVAGQAHASIGVSAVPPQTGYCVDRPIPSISNSR